MPRPMNAIMPPIKIMVMAMPALPEDRPAPMKTAPTSVMMLAMKRPYILSMSRNCDIGRGYHSFLYRSFGVDYSKWHLRDEGYLFMAPGRFTVVI